MERIWFIDKNTGEKVVAAVEKREDGKISFSYQGKHHTFSESLLGERVHLCPPETRELEELFYQGEYFSRENGRWTAADGSVPREKYQRRLSQLYLARCGHYGHSVKELSAFARGQIKDAEGINTAVRALEIALLKASAREARGFLPTLCSLYRRAGIPSAAISLYDYAVEKYGSGVETAALLTSVSAAYMDVGNINAAERTKNKAFALGGGDENLSAFMQRFDAETRLE